MRLNLIILFYCYLWHSKDPFFRLYNALVGSQPNQASSVHTVKLYWHLRVVRHGLLGETSANNLFHVTVVQPYPQTTTMASVFVPVAYVIIVFGGLFVFSFFYRKHTSCPFTPCPRDHAADQTILAQAFDPYFPSHPERNTYVTLLQKTDPPASDALLKSALLRRAMADVHRVIRIREDKPALQNLLQKGSIGDDLWNSLLNAEKELEAEIMEVVAEANSFVEGWGQVIFPTANEMIANEKMRATFEKIPETKAALGKLSQLLLFWSITDPLEYRIQIQCESLGYCGTFYPKIFDQSRDSYFGS